MLDQTHNNSLPESLCVFPSWTFFSTITNSYLPLFYLNIFLTKPCYPLHITYSSVNFLWFAGVNYPKFYDRPLFKPEAL